ncbi:potassium channel family protein [Streptomyces hesseae]|uniref:Potassium channel family protein n=1 Tax=Streptomyces hesseae TaxID=3075519 RepID=A0ABU2SXK8_9ACTN|nr:potassium channel family protein [Streptomyces sp. DSM 40473]MDT0452669.1 potassium channel family protein [Streptomyces sp. DSM 40473]
MTGRPPVGAAVRPLVTATALVLAYYLLPMDERFGGGAAVTLVLGLAALLLLFLWQLRSISYSPQPRLRAVETLATTVPLFLLLFATTYFLLERNVPGSFSETLDRTGALYFTLTVFSTVGFGDIVASSESARIVTMAQMTADVLLVGVAARVVVGAVESGLRRRETPDAAPPTSGEQT